MTRKLRLLALVMVAEELQVPGQYRRDVGSLGSLVAIYPSRVKITEVAFEVV